MTDIKLDIQVKGVTQLREAAKELLRTGNVSRKLASEFSGTSAANMRLVQETRRLEKIQRQLRKAVNDKIITGNKATRVLNEEIRKSKEKILTDQTLIAQEKKAAKAADERRKANERLVKLYAPAKVAQQQFEQSVKDINLAFQRGLINPEEYAEAMRVLNFEFNQFTKGAATGGNQFAKFNVEAYKSAQTIKRQFNTGMQQAGYQVGDFFVQIQSGQSALVALGQQGSQLAGIFGPGGALIGAFLAIGTAVGTIVLQAKKAEEALNSLKIGFAEASKSATESIRQLRTENYQLVNDIENSTLAMLALAKAEVETAKQANELRNETNLLGKTGIFEFGGGFSIAGLQIVKTDEQKLELLKEQSKILSEQLEKNKELLLDKEAEAARIEDLAKAEVELYEQNAAYLLKIAEQLEEDRLGLLADRGAAELALAQENAAYEAEQAKIALEDRLGLLADRGEAERRLAEENAAYEAEQARIVEEDRKGLLADRGRAEKQLADENAAYEKRVNAERKKQQQVAERFYTKTLNNLTNQNNTLEVQRKYFGQEKQIKEELRTLERLKLEDNIKLNKLSDDQADALRHQLRTLHGQEDAVESLIEKQKRLGKLRTPFSTDVSTLTDEQYQRMLDMSQYGPAVAAARGVTFESDKDKSKGKSPQDKVKDYIKSLKDQFQMEESLIGIFGEQRDLQEVLIQARQEYGDTATAAQMKTIEGYIQETHALEQQQKALEKAKAQQEQLKEAIVGSMENAFMSIVDGTKTVQDAFRTMAADIIKELYRVLVVKKTVEAITAVLPFAKGGVISNGNVVPYANGGVVGSPTYFPMSGGRTGLMGEAGPEAIMPLKRGKNGKLGVESSGQGDNIVVNQSFNFQANGDDSVKRIIAQQAPKIAQMTQQQIMDSRRRGGQMKAVFG